MPTTLNHFSVRQARRRGNKTLNGSSKRASSRQRDFLTTPSGHSTGHPSSAKEGMNGRAAATSIRAAALHRSARVLADNPRPLSKSAQGSTEGWRLARDVGLSLVLAAGLSTAVLAPLQASRTATTGRIRGASITRPLTVPVTISVGTGERTVTTQPQDGALAVALGQAAGAIGGSFIYVSRGQSIYPRAFLGQPNDATGRWEVTVNGQTINDVSQVSLAAGDRVRLERQVTS